MKIPQDMTVGARHKTNNFGMLEIVEFINYKEVVVRFIDSGYTTIKRADSIRAGRVSDRFARTVFGIGFVGGEEYRTSRNNKNEKSYYTWKLMLSRCYNEKNCSFYRYGARGVTVCEEWHNFQNFAKWFYENYPSDGVKYEMDKDIKVKGNKTYSPEFCMFVTQARNTEEAHAKNYKLISPEGKEVDIYNMSKFCRENNLKQHNMSKLAVGILKSHKGWTMPPK